MAWLNPNGIPCLSAVSRVNSLEDEPVWTPSCPPYCELTA